jgi:hypothetical protein
MTAATKLFAFSVAASDFILINLRIPILHNAQVYATCLLLVTQLCCACLYAESITVTIV